MPVYEYECSDCEVVQEFKISIADLEDTIITCEKCSQEMKRIVSMSSFRLKGQGWSRDGYTSGRERGAAMGDAMAKIK
jgi:putative FmdB family regulatory protein